MFKLLYQEKLEKINVPLRISKTQTLPVKFSFYLNLYFFSVFVCDNITNQLKCIVQYILLVTQMTGFMNKMIMPRP